MAISLWSVPLVLKALGQDDYGLYNLVAGIVAMLAFLNAAMTVSTQRYLSVTIGEKDENKLLQIYNLSFVLHIIIGLIVVLLVEASVPILFENVLTISADRQEIAHTLFHYLVVSMFFAILAVPSDAVLNAYENMLVFSVVGVAEAILRLAVALALPFIVGDKLNFYGFSMMGVGFLVFLSKFLYTKMKYRHLRFSMQSCRNGKLMAEMFMFAGWNTVGAIAIIGRNQGLAMVLNHFFGTIINAAYGIGNQINGVLSYFSQTIQKSLNPQLMESRGMQDQEKLKLMTFGLTKFSSMSMALVSIPLLVELPYVLGLWLGEIPDNTVIFTRCIVLLSLIYQMSSGVMSAIQSSGRIMYYTVTICLVLLSVLPISYAGLVGGREAAFALQTACCLEVVALFVRIWFAHKHAGISPSEYVSKVVFPITTLNVVTYGVLYSISFVMEESFMRLAAVGVVGVAIYCSFAYAFILNSAEKQKINDIAKKIRSKV